MKTDRLDSIPQIIRKMPKDSLESSFFKSLAYVVRDFAIVFACAYFIVRLDSWWMALPLSLVMGAAWVGFL